MPNTKVEVTMPDSVYRMIEDGYETMQTQSPTGPEIVAAFQEMINQIGMLLAPRYSPDPADASYFRAMDDNAATFGNGRVRTPEAETIGMGFLGLLEDMVRSGHVQGLIDDQTRGGDDPGNDPGCDPGGGPAAPDQRDKGDPW